VKILYTIRLSKHSPNDDKAQTESLADKSSKSNPAQSSDHRTTRLLLPAALLIRSPKREVFGIERGGSRIFKTCKRGLVKELSTDGLKSYDTFPAPGSWITTMSQGKFLEVRDNIGEAKILWGQYIRDYWSIPPDGRIEMTF
jgi:hypothetical protein